LCWRLVGSQPVSWPTYGGSLTSANLAPPRGLTAANAKKLHVGWSTKLDGSVFASPVVVRAPTGRRLVVAATEAGTVYALDAGNGRVAWSRAVTKTVGACKGTYGVTSTPGIDEQAGVVYVVGASGVLTALGVADGKVRWRLQVVRRISVENVWSAVRLFRGAAYIGVASYCDEPDASSTSCPGRTTSAASGAGAASRRTPRPARSSRAPETPSSPPTEI